MSDSWDRIREHEDGLRYDSFYVAPPGSYSRPDMNQGERTASADLIERARAALTFSCGDGRLERLVARFNSFMR
jgi:hypothetical protein